MHSPPSPEGNYLPSSLRRHRTPVRHRALSLSRASCPPAKVLNPTQPRACVRALACFLPTHLVSTRYPSCLDSVSPFTPSTTAAACPPLPHPLHPRRARAIAPLLLACFSGGDSSVYAAWEDFWAADEVKARRLCEVPCVRRSGAGWIGFGRRRRP
ncbi:hypothetical protein GUJ93_ZPchr0010g10981 [Zizania palustris]|uniref:Uncharacterized protein n=1 Tax=Zizania palustris TaxID=103762 RepID=A0A8J5WBY2_ZIZPA|nr:hypothetical protein GUJ93_ZPchr0010g10981 [Zizania palustris]